MIRKVRVALLKLMTILRIKIVAGTLLLQMPIILKKELELPVNKEVS